MFNSRLINTKVAGGGGGGCTDIVDNYDPFGGGGVALYQLNGNANDVSGNYNGTASNVTYGTGVFGQAAVFNGSSSSIDTNYSLGASSDSTVSMWFKTSNTATKFLLTQSAGSPYTSSMHIAIVSSGTGLELQIGASYNEFVVSNIANNSWHNLVLVRNAASGYTIYLDGSSIGTWANTTALEAADLFLGTRFDNTSLTFDGSIDQVRIFNTALTPLEVEALYTEELCICDGTVDTLDILGDGSCIATYQLDGNANDLSGNYSGTPTDVSYGVGEFDLAGVFNGSSSYIDITPKPSLVDTTVSFWLNTTTTETFSGLFGTGWQNAGSGSRWGFLQILLQSGKIDVRYGNPQTGQESISVQSVSSVNIGSWVNCIVSINNSILKIYINGSLETTHNVAFTRADTNNPISIGAYRQDLTLASFFNGSIDQVRIFNKALSAGEVTTLYNETACTVQPVPYSDYSALFNGTDEYMERTPSAASNRQVFTISVWFNTSSTGTRRSIISQGIDGNTFFQTEIIPNGNILVEHILGGLQMKFLTTATYDDGQWHNFIIAVNTNQSVPSNRVKLYVDGNQVTSFSEETYPSQGYNTLYNGTNKVSIGRISNCCLPFNGYLALLNSIDGFELDPTFFGEFNGAQWTPKGYAGSYGTNGFLLDFSNSSQLGEDLSGKNNNFSLVNMDSSNQSQNFVI